MKKIISIGVVFCFIFNLASQQLVQASLWQQRRSLRGETPQQMEISQAFTSPSSSFGFQQLQTFLESEKTSALQDKETGKIDAVLPQDFNRKVLPYSDIVSENVAEAFLRSEQLLNQNCNFIVLVQDAHQVSSAQKNIAGLTKILLDNGIGCVSAEGAWGRLDQLDIWRGQPASKAATDKLYQLGYLSGIENAILNTNNNNKSVYFGAENKKEYFQQVRAFSNSLNQEADVKNWQKGQVQRIINLKDNIYSQELKNLDLAKRQYEKGTLSLGKYVAKLKDCWGEKLEKQFPNVQRFVNLWQNEKSMNLSALSQAQKKVFESLSRNIEPADLQRFVQIGIYYRMGNVNANQFYKELQKYCQKYGVDIDPALQNYFSYVSLSSQIDKDAFFIEIQNLEKMTFSKQAQNQQQVELIELDRDFQLVQKALSFTLSPEQWSQFNSREKEILNLENRCRQKGQQQFLPVAVLRVLKSVNEFGVLSERRNHILLDNTLQNMASQHKKSAILVVGGWHSSGIESLMKKRGISYVVLRPKMDKANLSDNDPLRFFRGQTQSLEEILVPEKVNLNPPLGCTQKDVVSSVDAMMCSGWVRFVKCLYWGMNPWTGLDKKVAHIQVVYPDFKPGKNLRYWAALLEVGSVLFNPWGFVNGHGNKIRATVFVAFSWFFAFGLPIILGFTLDLNKSITIVVATSVGLAGVVLQTVVHALHNHFESDENNWLMFSSKAASSDPKVLELITAVKKVLDGKTTRAYSVSADGRTIKIILEKTTDSEHALFSDLEGQTLQLKEGSMSKYLIENVERKGLFSKDTIITYVWQGQQPSSAELRARQEKANLLKANLEAARVQDEERQALPDMTFAAELRRQEEEELRQQLQARREREMREQAEAEALASSLFPTTTPTRESDLEQAMRESQLQFAKEQSLRQSGMPQPEQFSDEASYLRALQAYYDAQDGVSSRDTKPASGVRGGPAPRRMGEVVTERSGLAVGRLDEDGRGRIYGFASGSEDERRRDRPSFGGMGRRLDDDGAAAADPDPRQVRRRPGVDFQSILEQVRMEEVDKAVLQLVGRLSDANILEKVTEAEEIIAPAVGWHDAVVEILTSMGASQRFASAIADGVVATEDDDPANAFYNAFKIMQIKAQRRFHLVNYAWYDAWAEVVEGLLSALFWLSFLVGGIFAVQNLLSTDLTVGLKIFLSSSLVLVLLSTGMGIWSFVFVKMHRWARGENVKKEIAIVFVQFVLPAALVGLLAFAATLIVWECYAKISFDSVAVASALSVLFFGVTWGIQQKRENNRRLAARDVLAADKKAESAKMESLSLIDLAPKIGRVSDYLLVQARTDGRIDLVVDAGVSADESLKIVEQYKKEWADTVASAISSKQQAERILGREIKTDGTVVFAVQSLQDAGFESAFEQQLQRLSDAQQVAVMLVGDSPVSVDQLKARFTAHADKIEILVKQNRLRIFNAKTTSAMNTELEQLAGGTVALVNAGVTLRTSSAGIIVMDDARYSLDIVSLLGEPLRFVVASAAIERAIEAAVVVARSQ